VRVVRALDLVSAATLIVFFAPLAATVAIGAGRPCLERETHLGAGRSFSRLRFRKRSDSFLEGSGFDSFPALFNVWAGDMSLVGPPSCPVSRLVWYPRLRSWLATAKPGLLDAKGLKAHPRAAALDRLYRRTSSPRIYLMILFHAPNLLLKAAGADRLNREPGWR
jgi:lipopolysaccharide/colanic/teichoic acid biosynthesis glycosyltransferase